MCERRGREKRGREGRVGLVLPLPECLDMFAKPMVYLTHHLTFILTPLVNTLILWLPYDLLANDLSLALIIPGAGREIQD